MSCDAVAAAPRNTAFDPHIPDTQHSFYPHIPDMQMAHYTTMDPDCMHNCH